MRQSPDGGHQQAGPEISRQSDRDAARLETVQAQGLPAKYPSATSTSAFTPVFMYFSSIMNCGE